MRQEMDFEAFKAITEIGFRPVYSTFAHDGTSFLKIVKIDLICEWRLEDGKIKFIQIPFETREELSEITDYLAECNRDFQNVISQRRQKLEKEIYNFGFNAMFKDIK